MRSWKTSNAKGDDEKVRVLFFPNGMADMFFTTRLKKIRGGGMIVITGALMVFSTMADEMIIFIPIGNKDHGIFIISSSWKCLAQYPIHHNSYD
jgi:hypothetical protein